MFGFNHDEAIRSFRKAAELDPRAPMPWWGIGLSLGSNINDPEPAADRLNAAHAAVQQARMLAANGPLSSGG